MVGNMGNMVGNVVDDDTSLSLLESPFDDNNQKNINAQGQRELKDIQPQLRTHTFFFFEESNLCKRVVTSLAECRKL